MLFKKIPDGFFQKSAYGFMEVNGKMFQGFNSRRINPC